MVGFTFRNIHSSALKTEARNIDRSVIPELRKNEFVIPGRHGTIDYGNNTYEKRLITVELGVFENLSNEEFRENLREIASWLSGKGMLIFDDEPNKAYQASVYSYIGIDPYNQENYLIDPLPAGTMTVIFECQPLAESLEYRQVNISNITTKPYEIPVQVNGTSETCCIITIKNNGTTNINNINIRRRAAI